MTDCPSCGEPLLPSQEWQLRADLTVGALETEEPCDQPYVHAWCDDRFAIDAEQRGGDGS